MDDIFVTQPFTARHVRFTKKLGFGSLGIYDLIISSRIKPFFAKPSSYLTYTAQFFDKNDGDIYIYIIVVICVCENIPTPNREYVVQSE